jgi:hypothetical protein
LENSDRAGKAFTHFQAAAMRLVTERPALPPRYPPVEDKEICGLFPARALVIRKYDKL